VSRLLNMAGPDYSSLVAPERVEDDQPRRHKKLAAAATLTIAVLLLLAALVASEGEMQQASNDPAAPKVENALEQQSSGVEMTTQLKSDDDWGSGSGCSGGCASAKTMRKVRDVLRDVKNLLKRKIQVNVNVHMRQPRRVYRRRRRVRRRRVRRRRVRRRASWLSSLASVPVWSGYCRSHSRGSGRWKQYCANGRDFNRAGAYLTVHGNGQFRVKRSGHYRLRFATIQYTSSWGQHDLRILVNGRGRDYSHNSHQRLWNMNEVDLTWRLNRGDLVTFQAYARGGNAYQFHSGNPTGHHSRVQISFLNRRPFVSTYCTHHARGRHWRKYCTNRWETINNTYFQRTGHGIRVRKAGYYRVNARAIQYSSGRQQQNSQLLINGRGTRYYSHNYRIGWARNILDNIVPLNAGDLVQVQYYTPQAGGYAFHSGNPYGHHSRLQLTWEGPRNTRRPIWSGGCSHHGNGRGWKWYCVNKQEFNTAGSYLRASGHTIHIKRSGLYRINAWSIQYSGAFGQQDAQIVINGRCRSYSHNYAQIWNRHSNDIYWRLNRGDRIQFRYYTRHNGYRFHSLGHHSRVQVSYEGRR